MKVFLKPGQVFISRSPALVTTILGSCVSVTMHCRHEKVGGICHALLPKCPAQAAGEDRLKYVDSSIAHMMERFRAMGISPDDIEIKLFGGADVLLPATKQTVGKANSEAALRILNERALRVIVSDIGGITGRKIIFSTDEGYVRVKRIGG